MPRLRSTVRARFPAPHSKGQHVQLAVLFHSSKTRRDSKSVMHRIANPARAVRLRLAPPRKSEINDLARFKRAFSCQYCAQNAPGCTAVLPSVVAIQTFVVCVGPTIALGGRLGWHRKRSQSPSAAAPSRCASCSRFDANRCSSRSTPAPCTAVCAWLSF